MAKRGYKLHDFVAHGSDVNCLSIGKKSCRLFLTGGEDCKVNLWETGKATHLMSLSGHTSSVHSVTFDSAEALVLAGASNGAIKLWDLEEAKLVRTIAGHRSNCAAVEFHPFGEFFASGSLDTDLKIWDIRKKGCIHTYKGHARGIRTIRFTPDGRWVVTGGEDHVVKLWDLTAGKLLHNLKFHNGIIRCIDFHPQEFLLATGSADRTVNFWDLETFELIGSAGPEATGVRSMVFHPDGRTLFCGLDETVKVFSWEPIRCHDNVDMGWSTLGDLSIYEGKLLGCSYHQSRVGVWVADISLIGPYGDCMSKNNAPLEPVNSYIESHSVEVKGSYTNSSMTLLAGPECGGKNTETASASPNISNHCSQSTVQADPIYLPNTTQLDATGFRRNIASMSCQSAPTFKSKFSSKVSTINSTVSRVSKATEVSPISPNRTTSNIRSRDLSRSSSAFNLTSSQALRKGPKIELDRIDTQTARRPVSSPVFVPKDSLDSERVVCTQTDSVMTQTPARSHEFCKLNYARETSFSGEISDRQLPINASMSSGRSADGLGGTNSSSVSWVSVNGETVLSHESNSKVIRNAAKKFERIMSLDQPVGSHSDKDAGPPSSQSETSSVKYVRGVAVQLGKTRSLVERWEKREIGHDSHTATESSLSGQTPALDPLQPVLNGEHHAGEVEIKADDNLACETLLQGHDVFINTVKSRLTKLQVIRHFWGRNSIKGVIDAVIKLPDHAVQADVISVLTEKIGLFTLDIFSCLLPLLSCLLNSKIERHASVSLELLFELFKIFGPVICSTVSSPSLVGVDLQAEQRMERCKQCFNHLQKIQKVLPLLIKKGGMLAIHAQKLNLALSQL